MFICGLVPTIRIAEDDPDLLPQDCIGVIGCGMPKIRKFCQQEGIRAHMLPPGRSWGTLSWRFVPQLLENRSEILQAEFSESVPVQFQANLTRWPAEFKGSAGRRYVFVEPIGLGGTAVVGRFCDERGNSYAAKSLSNHRFPKDLTEDRFSREAELLARIEHPNVVRILDQGKIPESHVIVMEDLPKGSLYQRLQQGVPSSDVALQWIREILIGVGELHSRNIVHRDLTPKNLLFRESGELVVSDFGTVRHLDDATITNTADQLGSLIYSAPEQVADPHAAGTQADVYSVGQIAFLLCTGISPLGNTGELSKHTDGLGREIAEVLETFRAYDPGDRPVDANAALTRLDEASEHHRERTQPWRPVLDVCEQVYGPLQLIADQLLYAGQRSWSLRSRDAYLLLDSILIAVENSLSWISEFEDEGGQIFALEERDQFPALPKQALGIVRGPQLHVRSELLDDDSGTWTVWSGSNGLIARLTEWREELLSGEVALLPSALHVDKPNMDDNERVLDVEAIWDRVRPVPT